MKSVKTLLKVFGFGLIMTSVFASCGSLLDDNRSSDSEVKYGSFELEDDRSLTFGEITSAKVTVTGSDFTTSLTADVSVTDGKASGIVVKNIPIGKNRIVSVQAFNGEKKVEGARVAAVIDINEGTNSGSVNQETSKKAFVYDAIKNAGVNITELTAEQETSIANAIPSVSHALFIDSAELAKDFKAGSLKASSSYKLKSGTVKSTSTVSGSYTLKISDPASANQSLAASNTFTDAVPGKWVIYALDSTGEVAASASINVVSEEETIVKVTEAGSVSKDTITVFAPKTTDKNFIYAWNDSTGEKYFGAWPGKQMEDNGEYLFAEIPATSSSVILNNGGSIQTPDLLISSAGGWMFNGSGFDEYNNSSSGSGSLKITVVNPEYIDVTNSIIVHAKYACAYIWGTGNTSIDNKSVEMTAEENGWYVTTINATSAQLLFKPNTTDWNGKTGDLTRTEVGEYWYKNGNWYDGNPDDSELPVLVSFTADKSGTVDGEIKFTIDATDNLVLTQAILTIDSTTTKSVKLSGKSDSAVFTLDTATISNGAHIIECVVQDGAENVSAKQSIQFSTLNAPKASISGVGSARYDSETTYTFNGTGSVDSYAWSVTGATLKSGAGTKSIVVQTPASGESFTVKLTVKNAVGSSSDSKTVKLTNGATGDFRDESIYFLMTTRFYDGDTSNNEYCWDEGGEYLAFGTGDCAWRGDFKGLAEKLDYIKALGFSAIWITPVVENASGIDYHGYHAYDFSKVDPRYESAGFTYQDLIDACHAKGIKVVQDIVLNHSGNFGEKNIFHMFDKETTPYINKDVPTPAGGKRSPFMKVAKDGEKYSHLMQGLSSYGTQDYDNAKGAFQYGARINAMKEDSIDTDFIYHHAKMIDWNSENCQLGQMAGDCVDLNTENPVVFNYLKQCYTNYINMGVDAFRIDTVKHISRYTFNKEFIPAFMEAGGDSFYIFGETCARYRGRWNEGVPALSPSFYTWKEDQNFPWSQTDHTVNSASATAHFGTYRGDYTHPAWADGTANHLLKGNNYHTPDWSMRSHLDQIDFPMHWAFSNANDAFQTAVNTNDPDFNDATWNVVYVDSHDYAPDNAPEGQRYAKTEEWPRNMNLMFTFRGIPCIYYGSEVEFMAGAPIDPANTRTSLDKSGRAYFGDYLEGTVTASDYGTYTATGTVADTLNHPLSQQVIRLNKIRRSIAALRKGQYSTAGCSGAISFKRRYTDDSVDSFVLVAVGGQATFSGVPAGDYIEVITGKTVSCSGTLTSDAIDQNNARIYVLKTATCEVSGKIGEDGAYLK